MLLVLGTKPETKQRWSPGCDSRARHTPKPKVEQVHGASA